MRRRAIPLLHRLLFPPAFVCCKLFFGVVLRFPLFCWLRIDGREHVPRRGGLIVIANHLSVADPIVLWYAAPRHICFMGRADVFQLPLIGGIVRLARAIPVRQRSADRAALMEAIEAVRDGEALGIFPEGECSETGELQPFLPGVLLVLRQTRAPVLPVGITGTPRLIPYGKLFPRPAFSVITVKFGCPIPAERILALPSPDQQLEFLRDQVAQLL
ncbi:MAG: lysophospholipid acyltransferase family protein [Armatimonadota bacterium]